MKLTQVVLAFLFTLSLSAQPAIDYSIQTWAVISDSIPTITINWVAINDASKYQIFRKEKEDKNWGSSIANLGGEITSFEDTGIITGTSYEYKIKKSGNVVGYGYINAGIKIQAKHNKGKLLLLVDQLFSSSLDSEINQLIKDLIGDGWKVVRKDVDREDSVYNIKEIIENEYYSETAPIEAIYCFGHIPVPYSGNYAPDGHPNHKGAWPTDGYYADMDGIWTDQYTNNTTASQARHHNIPNDGKFDQLHFTSELEMQIGRVDFANMPAFALSEEELLRAYLNKSHSFKIGDIQVKMQAVIDDNFGGFNGEAFAGSAWKSFSPLLHPDNINAGDYRSSMDTSSYIWSYGCGGGSYSSCNGIGTTANLAGDSLQGIFSSMFGSYFGDWDSQNNIMRTTLAQGTILTNCWSGRPHWYFHHMGLGENIGYSTRLSMNNKGTFYHTPLNFLGNIISMGLMGDPSLKMYIIKPIVDLTGTFNNNDIELN